MQKLKLRNRVFAALAATSIGFAGLMVPAKAATTTFTDCYLYSAGEPDFIDPHLSSTLAGANASIMLFDGLTETDESGKLVGAAAEKWTTKDKGLTWVFTIKKGLKFSNGDPVLPSSFVAGWKRAADPKLGSEVAYHTYFIAGMEEYNGGKGTFPTSNIVANDAAMTLTVKMVSPTTDWPAIVSHSVFSPIPKSMEGASAKVEEDGTKLIGNGPYMLEKAITKRKGGEINLVANPNYAGPKPTLTKITFKISSDVNAAYNAFASGQCDNGPIPAGRYTELLGKWGTKGFKTTLGTDYWGFNWEDPTVGGDKNRLLRSAIAKAIDRNQISTVIYQGTRKPTSGLLPPGLPGFKDGQGLTATRDLEGAKKDIATWKKQGNSIKSPIRLSYNDGAGWDKVASIIIANLKDIGVDAKLDPFPADGTYFSKMRKGQGQMIRAGWFADYPIADNFLFPLLHSKSIDGDNLERYKSTVFDSLVDAGRAATNKSLANSAYQRAEKHALVNDVVIVPTVNRGIASVVGTKVVTYPVTPLGMVFYNEVVLS